MKLSWDKPPAAIVVAGTEEYLRRRWTRYVLSGAHAAGFDVSTVYSDDEVVSTLSMAGAFGMPTVVAVSSSDVTPQTVADHVAGDPKKTCMVIEVHGALDEKKHPVIVPVHGAYQITFDRPSTKRQQIGMAEKFIQAEATRLMRGKEALDPKLAAALVKTLGTDLGVLAFETSKVAALARSQREKTLSVAHVKAVMRGNPEADMAPLRVALARADGPKVAKALLKIRLKSSGDPTMLLLRARGGPADLAYQWLRASLLVDQQRTSDPKAIARTLGVPEWAVAKEILPAARRWGSTALRQLVRDLSRVDRGVLLGVPAPWVACEAALLGGCCSVDGR